MKKLLKKLLRGFALIVFLSSMFIHGKGIEAKTTNDRTFLTKDDKRPLVLQQANDIFSEQIGVAWHYSHSSHRSHWSHSSHWSHWSHYSSSW